MTIEPFKVQGMTFHLDSWEEADDGIWDGIFFRTIGEKLATQGDRIVSTTVKVQIRAATKSEAWEKLQGQSKGAGDSRPYLRRLPLTLF